MMRDMDADVAEAMEIAWEQNRASSAMFQRRMRLGYMDASRLMDELERRGYVGPMRGWEPRKILIPKPNGQAEAGR